MERAYSQLHQKFRVYTGHPHELMFQRKNLSDFPYATQAVVARGPVMLTLFGSPPRSRMNQSEIHTTNIFYGHSYIVALEKRRRSVNRCTRS
jgi:hypothetical protein